MNKRSFKNGLIVGGALFVLTAMIVYFKFSIQPDISLSEVEVTNLDGAKVELNDYLGKPLVVNYWGTWCAPCLQEFPHFEKVKKQLGEDVNFIMISDESIDKINKFSSSKPYTFNYLRSEREFGEYGITVRPTTYFYDSQGKLVAKHSSDLDVAKLSELVEMIK
ncbi:MAG: TlpA disulfide reductase family protein [Bacteroidota bacterium]